jgi:transmembrane sensor
VSPAEINLTAGEQLSYEVKTGAVKRASADIPRVSAWRARKLDFSDTPLADAIVEANRYSRVQIELNAPELQNARISGTFEAGRNDLFVEGLQSYFQLTVERPTDRRIVLTARH